MSPIKHFLPRFPKFMPAVGSGKALLNRHACFLLVSIRTVMDDTPYTTPDEDPFHALPIPSGFDRPRSVVNGWVEEPSDKLDQRPVSLPPPQLSRASTSVLAFLAYAELPRLSVTDLASTVAADHASICSYDLVDDDDIPDIGISTRGSDGREVSRC